MGAKSAQGTVVSRETAAGSGTFVPMVNVKSFDGPSTENPEIDVTTLSSTAKEFLPGVIDYGGLSMQVFFDPENTTHQQIFTDMEASPPTVTGWRISFANPTRNYTWLAFVKSFHVSGQVDGVYEGQLTLRLTGPRVVS